MPSSATSSPAPSASTGSDPLGILMWDAYTLVVLLTWEDLAAGRFDRTRAVLARS